MESGIIMSAPYAVQSNKQKSYLAHQQCINDSDKKSLAEQVYKRGDIWMADFGNGVGSEQRGKRPVLIIQNNVGNKYSPTVIVVAISSQIQKAKLPTHIELTADIHGLDFDSVLLCEQIRTVDKRRLVRHISTLGDSSIGDVEKALMVSMGMI